MIRPIGNRVLCVPAELQKETAGGILIPEVARETGQITATVHSISTSRDSKSGECPVDVGDTVLYSAMVGMDLKVYGKKYTIVLEKDLLAVIE